MTKSMSDVGSSIFANSAGVGFEPVNIEQGPNTQDPIWRNNLVGEGI